MTLRVAATCAVVAALAAVAVPASADHQAGHAEPQGPAKVAFAEDFPVLADHEWGFPIGGFGGVRRGAPILRPPVIFVHGNNVDHADWYPVRDDFLAAGWSEQELWALSYNGLGCNNGSTPLRSNPQRDEERREMGWDGACRVTNNDVNVPDLHGFILAVQRYTGSRRFSLVGHSLGVTLARKTLKVHPELREDLVAFVGIAGANHGTNLCAPGSEGHVMSCDEIAADTPWLEELNGPGGEDETYPPARWLTIYDGSGAADVAFLGTYAGSPRLEGAENRTFPGTDHNGLRMHSPVVAEYRQFLEQASAPGHRRAGPPERGDPAAPGSDPATSDPSTRPSSPVRSLPATGGGGGIGIILGLAAVAVQRARWSQRSG